MSEVAKATDLLASTRHLATCVSSEAPASSLDIAMSSPSLPEAPPTLADLLKDARRRFMHLSRAGQVDDGEEESPLEVVVTRGITREAFDAMDEDLLYGLVVELRDDGTLVLVEVLSKEYTQAKFQIACTADNYAEANVAQDTVVQNDWQDEGTGEGPDNRRPSVTILEEMADGFVPLVIFIVHIEGQSGSFCDMIRKAAFFFNTIPDLKRVVGVQFFRRHRGLPTLLQVPALAVAFGRGAEPAAVGADRLVRILAARSFGNYPLHGNATNTLQNPPDNVPLDPYADTARLRREWFPCELHVDNVVGDLRALVRGRQTHTLPAPMVVPMPQGYPELQLPLFQIFVAAMRGWYLDMLARG